MKDEFFAQHALYTLHINKKLDSYLDEIKNSTLKDAIKYSLLANGKRIRPFIIHLITQLFKINAKKTDVVACAIEMIHTYTLIHDDLPSMDNDDMRRGKPTCHIQFDEATAILAGDSLQSLAFNIIAKNEHFTNKTKIDLISTLSDAIGANGLCYGQNIDLVSQNKQIGLKELDEIHFSKTGALICATVNMAIYAVGSQAEPYKDALLQYASYIGLAFQIQDDILDVIGKTEIIGKQIGSDQKLVKNTYPALLGLDESIKRCEMLHKKACEALDSIPYDTSLLSKLADFIIKRNH